MVLRLRRHRLRRLSREDKKVKSFGRPFCGVSGGYEATTVGEQGEVGNVMEADK